MINQPRMTKNMIVYRTSMVNPANHTQRYSVTTASALNLGIIQHPERRQPISFLLSPKGGEVHTKAVPPVVLLVSMNGVGNAGHESGAYPNAEDDIL